MMPLKFYNYHVKGSEIWFVQGSGSQQFELVEFLFYFLMNGLGTRLVVVAYWHSSLK